MRNDSLPAVTLALALSSFGSAQDRSKPWYAMDYGPVISTTLEGFRGDNVAYKGRAIRLGDGAGVVFDTELLRVTAAFDGGYLQLRGTPYDGSHGPIPRCVGSRMFETRPQPGWTRNGSFEDPREIPYGPLPREWARYDGFYLSGEDAVIAYTVGGATRVLEHFAAGDFPADDGAKVRGVARTISADRIDAAGATVYVTDAGDDASMLGDRGAVIHETRPLAGRVRLDSVDDWARMGIGAPSAEDAAHGATVTWVDGVGALHPNGARPAALVDGAIASHEDEPAACVFSDDSNCRFVIELETPIDVRRISSFSWHKDDRARQRFRVFGSLEAKPVEGDLDEAGWTHIASVDTADLGVGGRHGASIANEDGSALGEFRFLLFDADKASAGTFFTEIDVFAMGQPDPIQERREATFVNLIGGVGATLAIDADRRLVLRLPAGEPRQLVRLIAHQDPRVASENGRRLEFADTIVDPVRFTKGGPRRWAEELVTEGRRGDDRGAYAVDAISVPKKNPWNSILRFGAFDFTGDESAALSTWNGDVWEVTGIDDDLDELRWRRIATGLHDPLGLKVVDGVIHTLGRDGITRLHDLNGDGEIDWFENFNNDVLATRNFHEFAFDLQLDGDGNFYFSKGGPVKPGGRGFDEIVPHHGTIMQVSKDGSELKVVATGLRAPNGIAVSPDGVLTSGDNEGTWMPKCRLNWFPRHGMFASCVDTSHMDPRPTEYGDPLCWFPMDVDNSGGGQVWVTSDRWGPLRGRLLHQSYGTCNLYLVLAQHAGDRTQGGVAKFPLSFDSSLMRGRFHEVDGQLYVVGFKGWQTRAVRETAFHRVRYTGKALSIPTGLSVGQRTIDLRFDVELDAELATDPESFVIEIWDYRWTDEYGSAEVKPSEPEKKVKYGEKNRDSLAVESAELLPDGKTVRLTVDGLKRVMQMRINYDLESVDGAEILGDVFNTVNFLGEQ